MGELKGYLELVELDHVKDYDVLEDVPGFVVVDGDSVSAAINTRCDAAFIALLEFLPGKPRGNHYHNEKAEHMTVLTGALRCEFWLPSEPDDVRELVLTSGQMIIIQPGCAHTYTAVDEKVKALEFSPQAYRKNDTIAIDHP